MSDGPQWFVSVEGQQHGPYTGEQLVEFTQTGNITRESMVWTEGMAEWLPAAQIEGLFPAPAPVQVQTTTAASNFMRPGHAAPAYGGYAMGQPTGQVQAAGGFRHPQINAASFGLWAGSIGIGFLFFIVSAVLMPQAAAKAETNPAMVMVLLGMTGLGWVCLLLSSIFGYMILYRAWKCLSLAGATVTPGAAVGFMFIPLFSLYWIFRAFAGFAKEWNFITAAYEETRMAPRMSEGLFLAFCICIVSVIGAPIAFILAFPVFSSMCRAINFIAFRPVQQPGALRFR